MKQLIKIMNDDPKKYTIKKMKENYEDEDYWKAILRMMKFENDFIKECIEDINIKYLIKYQTLDNEIILWLNNNFDISEHYDMLIEYQILPNELLIKYIDSFGSNLKKIDWKTIVETQDLSEDLLTKYKEYLDMNLVSQEQYLTLKFILLNNTDINWEILPTNLKTKYLFNDSFVELFEDKAIWTNIGWMELVSMDCIFKYTDKINSNGWYTILEHKELTMDNLEKILEIINDNNVWEIISGSQELTNEFIDKYNDKLIWTTICLFQDLSWDMIEKYHTKISLKFLSKNDCLTKELVTKISENKELFNDELEEYEFNIEDVEHMPPIF